MKRRILEILVAAGFVAFAAAPVGAIDLIPNDVCNPDVDASCKLVKQSEGELPVRVKNIINVALFILAGVAVMMIVIGGLRMVLANGDAGAVKSGRLTILWSIVGVVVALFSYTIVNFVVNWNWLR